MAQIIRFPSSARYVPLQVRSSQRHSVSVRITDSADPYEARHHMQWPIIRAANFTALTALIH